MNGLLNIGMIYVVFSMLWMSTRAIEDVTVSHGQFASKERTDPPMRRVKSQAGAVTIHEAPYSEKLAKEQDADVKKQIASHDIKKRLMRSESNDDAVQGALHSKMKGTHQVKKRKAKKIVKRGSVTESSIWLDKAPLLHGNMKDQAEFCKAHPGAVFDQERMKASIEIVRTVTTALRKAGIPPMIMDGTLLGLSRQGFLIDGDMDLDFWIPRQFMNTRKQWNSLTRAMMDQDIYCFSVFRQWAAGWKIACNPRGRTATQGWKVNNTDSGRGFYMDLSVIDEATNGCHAPPCSWINYLTTNNKTYPGIVGPFNWRLASWHNVTLWVPSEPQVPLAQLYTSKWKEPAGTNYDHWLQNTPIPEEKKRSYFKNMLDLNSANVLKLQERLEQANARQVAEDAKKQWALAVDFCSAKNEEYVRMATLNATFR